MYNIEVLPAAHGDALWVEYGKRDNPRRIVIDGGPAPTYERGLHLRLLKVPPEQARRIDLLVITHIDCDHIDGPVILLQEFAKLGVTINEVWFNAFKHLGTAQGDHFQPLQGEFLGALVATTPKLKRNWNKSFAGKTVIVPDTGKLPVVKLPDKATLTLLSPCAPQLKRLRAKWSAAIRDFTPGSEREALQRLKDRREYVPPTLPDVFAAKEFGSDRSPPNGSSIAFLLEHDGHSCLFGADAYARVLTQSLRRLAQERGLSRIKVDVVKLPHHGSMGNVSEELMDTLEADRWIISTNGAVFGHPDPETVALIARKSARPPRILCNYRVPTTQRLVKPNNRKWTVEFPQPGATTGLAGGLKLTLGN